MAAHKKTSFYHTRKNICPNDKQASEIFGVTVDDVKRMDAEGDPAAERLLRLWDRKYVGLDGWDGWLFSRGVLRPGRYARVPCPDRRYAINAAPGRAASLPPICVVLYVKRFNKVMDGATGCGVCRYGHPPRAAFASLLF